MMFDGIRGRGLGWALCAAMALGTAGCGGGGDGGQMSGTPGVNADVKFLSDYMADWYFWYSQLPAVDLTTFATPEDALTAMRVAQDRFSFIETAETFNALFDNSQALGFGFGYIVLGTQVWIRFVQPLANAATAGLQRGDRLVAVGGTPVETLIAQNTLDASFGPAQDGYSLVLSIQRGTQMLDLPMTKSWYTVKNVLDARVLDNAGRKVGYINFFSFNTPAQGEWNTALQQVLDGGAQDLVVDLRENGGGLLSVATALSSSMAPAGQSGQLYGHLEFNDKHVASDSTLSLQAAATAGRIDNLVWITSPRTCSASESLMVSLRPYRSAMSVGETTCGKPVGFTAPTFDGKVYNVVTFRSVNRDGFTDYYQGLAPDCSVADDYATPFGDPNEPKLAVALQTLRTGTCPAATTKSIERHLPPVVRGMVNMTGLY
jgi:carboxyl-terminal processing protease